MIRGYKNPTNILEPITEKWALRWKRNVVSWEGLENKDPVMYFNLFWASVSKKHSGLQYFYWFTLMYDVVLNNSWPLPLVQNTLLHITFNSLNALFLLCDAEVFKVVSKHGTLSSSFFKSFCTHVCNVLLCSKEKNWSLMEVNKPHWKDVLL